MIDADDLALLATGFEAALRGAPDPHAATSALGDLGWGEVLAASPAQAVATAFGAIGTTGAVAGILDDVLALALGVDPSPEVAVVLPAPTRSAPPGAAAAGRFVVDGTATARLGWATTALVVIDDGHHQLRVVAVDAAALRTDAPLGGLDPGATARRVRAEVDPADAAAHEARGSWSGAMAAGRVALAHELVATARTMLDQARAHAVDRVQFGRPVASFQAVRHRLAESLAAIEAAAAALGPVGDHPDPLHAAVAKSLAGQAARTTATHAQQVLAGIGFTTDHPFHLSMKRALVLDALLGSAASLPTEIGAELLARRAAPRLVEL